jgi:hypothetical protein
MPHLGKKAINRAKANRQRKHRGPRMSRTRLQNMREDLQRTKKAVTEVIEKFWIIPEGEIRETLAQTEKKIDRAVKVLQHAA